MKNIKMLIEYDGSRYNGWQKQGNTDQTIQGKIEKILEVMTGESVEIHGSGRTDAGVHAKGQVANVHLDEKFSAEYVRNYLNEYLPEDIAVLSAEETEPLFHSRLKATAKIYTYYIETAPKKSVFKRKYVYGYGKSLNIEAMKKAAEFLMGEHDFKSFCGNKKMKKSTIRTIMKINIIKEGSMVRIDFLGNGFLQNMVRILTGTLIEVGEEKRRPESMKEILEIKDRQSAGFMAPPEGLFLMKVYY